VVKIYGSEGNACFGDEFIEEAVRLRSSAVWANQASRRDALQLNNISAEPVLIT
jgi:hypothetical protein